MDYDNFEAELNRVADEIVLDTLYPERYEARRQNTLDWTKFFSWPELTTVANVIRESRIINGRGDQTWHVRDLAEARRSWVASREALGATILTGAAPELK
jgi:hypothetical protein